MNCKRSPHKEAASYFSQEKLKYMHENPVKAGIVEKPKDYLCSSARDYYGVKGLIEIDFPDPLIITV